MLGLFRCSTIVLKINTLIVLKYCTWWCWDRDLLASGRADPHNLVFQFDEELEIKQVYKYIIGFLSRGVILSIDGPWHVLTHVYDSHFHCSISVCAQFSTLANDRRMNGSEWFTYDMYTHRVERNLKLFWQGSPIFYVLSILRNKGFEKDSWEGRWIF